MQLMASNTPSTEQNNDCVEITIIGNNGSFTLTDSEFDRIEETINEDTNEPTLNIYKSDLPKDEPRTIPGGSVTDVQTL